MADVQHGNTIRLSARRQILLRVSLAVFATFTLSLRSGPTADLAMAMQADITPNGPPTMVRMGWLRKPPQLLSQTVGPLGDRMQGFRSEWSHRNLPQDGGRPVTTFKVGFEPQETLVDLKKAVHARTNIPVDEIDLYSGYDILEKDAVTIQSVAEKEIKRRGLSESTAGLPVLYATDRRLDLEGADAFDVKRYQEKKGSPMDWALYAYDRDTSEEKAKWDAKQWPWRGESLKTKKTKQ